MIDDDKIDTSVFNSNSNRSNSLEAISDKSTALIDKKEDQLKSQELLDHEKLQEKNFKETQRTLRNLADTGLEATDEMARIAQETGEPKAFAALANIMKTTAAISKSIIDTDMIRRAQIRDKENPDLIGASSSSSNDSGAQKLVQNNSTIYIGTTKELVEKIKKEKSLDIFDLNSNNESEYSVED